MLSDEEYKTKHQSLFEGHIFPLAPKHNHSCCIISERHVERLLPMFNELHPLNGVIVIPRSRLRVELIYASMTLINSEVNQVLCALVTLARV